MSEATDKVKALRAELARAEATEKAERTAKREAEKAARRAKAEADTDAYREENYEFTAGDYGDYIGVTSGFDGGVELTVTEWTTPQSSVGLNREQVLALIAGLQEIVK
jgi:hypothetical protein